MRAQPITDPNDVWTEFVLAVEELRITARPGLAVEEALSEAIAGWLDEQRGLYLRQ